MKFANLLSTVHSVSWVYLYYPTNKCAFAELNSMSSRYFDWFSFFGGHSLQGLSSAHGFYWIFIDKGDYLLICSATDTSIFPINSTKKKENIFIWINEINRYCSTNVRQFFQLLINVSFHFPIFKWYYYQSQMHISFVQPNMAALLVIFGMFG